MMVEVDGDAPQEVVEAAAEAAVEAAEEVVREAVAKEGEEEAAADEEPAVKEVHLADRHRFCGAVGPTPIRSGNSCTH